MKQANMNLVINYGILEQIIKIIGWTKFLVGYEYDWLDSFFEAAKRGELPDRHIKDLSDCFIWLQELTGAGTEYWCGEKRINIGFKVIGKKDNQFVFDDESRNLQYIEAEDGIINEATDLEDIYENPLAVDRDIVIESVTKGSSNQVLQDYEKYEKYDVENIVNYVYSMDGLLRIAIWNAKQDMKRNEEIYLLSKDELIYGGLEDGNPEILKIVYEMNHQKGALIRKDNEKLCPLYLKPLQPEKNFISKILVGLLEYQLANEKICEVNMNEISKLDRNQAVLNYIQKFTQK